MCKKKSCKVVKHFLILYNTTANFHEEFLVVRWKKVLEFSGYVVFVNLAFVFVFHAWSRCSDSAFGQRLTLSQLRDFLGLLIFFYVKFNVFVDWETLFSEGFEDLERRLHSHLHLFRNFGSGIAYWELLKVLN